MLSNDKPINGQKLFFLTLKRPLVITK